MIPRKKLGVALDLGTTTVQGRLVDLSKKSDLSDFSCLNEQLTLGHDVISRIKLALEKPRGLEKLNRRIISCINFVIDNLLASSGESESNISLIASVSNTAIYHFILSLSPKKLVEPPYEPEYKELIRKPAKELGVKGGEKCEYSLLPNVGGFVGSDAIAVIMASGMDESGSPVLAVDIGTNGEIMFGSREKIFVASTAAGPAFEGWHIGCGMRPVEGAIETVIEKNGRLFLKVIGNVAPKGISGSGLVDIVAIMLNKGTVEGSGRTSEEFVICKKPERISVSGNDVRQVQLAKAAFSAGINSLRRIYGADPEKLIITGSFGRSLDRDNAKRVGIIPRDIDTDKVEIMANGALKGAEMFVKDKRSVSARVKKILGKTEHVSFGQDKAFQKEFIERMKF